MSHAIIAAEAGGPEVLHLEETTTGQPGHGQLLVKVAAAGVNFIDMYQRGGLYPVPFPFTPGAEAAGEVIAVGDGVDGYSVGDRVATGEGRACYARHALIDAAKALPVPDGISDQVAAAIPLQGMTAHYLINSTYKVQSGQTVLTHAGAGGVGLLLTQLLKAAGARVITTVSTEDKEVLARKAGANEVLGYEGLVSNVHELTDGTGVDVVFDGVGKSTFDDSLASLRTRGTMVLFGAASGPVPEFDLQRLNAAGSLYVTRPKLADYLLDIEERRWRSSELFDAILSGELSVDVGASYPLADAAQAHADLQARKTTGKVLLVP
ncbi:quinone oxidoreductase family protein [Arthrobacter castelli]|uniref:quinone oxidoreductase family protein n=1 Tax=Arthrobacter castelli TaxID=271431 RepID=UPI0004235039|nr:quinone oxidoreductase [Arthrobacter castelli]